MDDAKVPPFPVKIYSTSRKKIQETLMDFYKKSILHNVPHNTELIKDPCGGNAFASNTLSGK